MGLVVDHEHVAGMQAGEGLRPLGIPGDRRDEPGVGVVDLGDGWWALVVSPKLQSGFSGGITPVTTAVNIFGALSISFGTVYQKRFATSLNLASGGAWQYVGATFAVAIPALLMEELRFDGSFDAWFALGWSVVVLSLGEKKPRSGRASSSSSRMPSALRS